MAIQAQFYPDNFGFSLGASQDSFMENGCGFDNLCLTPQQQHQFMQFDQFHKNLNNPQFHHQSMPFSAQIDKQRQEFEHLVNSQNESLVLALEEQRKHQVAVLMKKYESKTRFLLLQKDEEIAKASNRSAELQNLLKKLEMEKQAWQRMAKENESTVTSLNSLIQRVTESVCLSTNAAAAEDAESCCPDIQQENENRKLMCKCCNSRNSCVVMLPCRHLSSCQHCEVFLDSCPLCTMPKKATIEALI